LRYCQTKEYFPLLGVSHVPIIYTNKIKQTQSTWDLSGMSQTELNKHIEKIKSHEFIYDNSIGYSAWGANRMRSYGKEDSVANMIRLMESGVTHQKGLVIFVYRVCDTSAKTIAKALKSGKCAANLTLVFHPNENGEITNDQKTILNKAWQHYENNIANKTNIAASSRLFNQAKLTIASTPAPNNGMPSSSKSTLPPETPPLSYDEAVAALLAIRKAASAEEYVASASISCKK
jgi:hypothetical protein